MKLRNRARDILLSALLSTAALQVVAADLTTPGPVAKAVGEVLAQTSEPVIAGFRWGSPVATLAASTAVKPNAGLSAKCVSDFVSTTRPDCVAFVPTSGSGFARAYYATRSEGLLMVESNATQFDCARFDDMASPDAGHRAELGRMGWSYLRRDRRPEGRDAIVESQLFTRNGIGVELTFIKARRMDSCGVKSFVSKML
jgi:hypothetical protein